MHTTLEAQRSTVMSQHDASVPTDDGRAPAGQEGAARQARLTIGTRASPLALAQTDFVAAALTARWPGLAVGQERITTTGDIILDRPLDAIDGKGLFVTEIEDAMRAGRIDLAVHSAKDLPSALPPDMCLGAILRRVDPRDVLVGRDGHTLDDLPPGARVGTSSPRRVAQLRALRPDLRVSSVRGNVGTRLRRLDAGDFDALVLAAAGLGRLGLLARATQHFDPAQMLPSVGQGALAVETRAGDAAVAAFVAPLADVDTTDAVTAERAFLAAIGGGCSAPVAAYAEVLGDAVALRGFIGAPDGRAVRGARDGARQDAASVGRALAAELLAAGGEALLAGPHPPHAWDA